MRRAALGALAQGLEETQRRMLSEDLDGIDPFLDPGQAITERFANKAAQALKTPVEEIKAQYEALAARFKLRLAWQAKPTSTR